MSLLFSPLQIGSVTIPNRIVVSPMCQYSSEDGFANDWHLVHAGSRAVGGAGMVMLEATAVSPEGRITLHDLGIWKEDHVPFLKRIAEFISARNSVPAIQLAHAGRKASHHVPWKGAEPLMPGEGAWTTMAPSSIPFKNNTPAPVEMSLMQIRTLVDDFRAAARRVLQAGFKVIEIHAAHGYLIHEFLSPVSNHRQDSYGGSFEDRTRILTEIIAAVREEWPGHLPLFVRISATEWVKDAWTIEDSVSLASVMKRSGVDLVDCSTGGNIPGVKIPLTPLYQVPFAERIRKEAGIMTGAVGLITTAEEGELILQQGQADLVFMARELLRNPYFPLQAAKQLGADLKWPDQYLRAKK